MLGDPVCSAGELALLSSTPRPLPLNASVPSQTYEGGTVEASMTCEELPALFCTYNSMLGEGASEICVIAKRSCVWLEVDDGF